VLELPSRFASDADFLSNINSHQVFANLKDARIGAFRPRQQFVVGIGWTNDMGVHGQFRTRPGENFPSLFRCGVVVNDSLRSFGSGWIESADRVTVEDKMVRIETVIPNPVDGGQLRTRRQHDVYAIDPLRFTLERPLVRSTL